KVYFCKHCDYSNVNSDLVSSHYASDHPYVRCNSGYIQQSSDQSATFRCLECPVEFLSTVDLKWHYTEKHPEAPDVFKMKLNELKLEFKCFTCTFTCSEVRDLRYHYKQKHRTWEVDNSLLFCQYLVKECQKMCEKTSSPEKSVELPPKRTSTPHKEVEITLSRQPPTSTGPDAMLYKCIKCQFEHKSAVAMQVHYQKKHPEKSVSLDEIKQLARAMTPEKKSLQKEKSTVQIKEKATTPEVPKGSPDHLRIENDMHYCQFCSYASPQIRSVIGHHNAKHAAHMPLSKEDIIQYSAEVIENKSPITFKTTSHIKNGNEPKTQIRKTEVSVHVDQLYFCHLCNLGNPSTQGIIAHQNKVHQYKHSSRKSILKYSALVREKIEENGSYSSKLPLPIITEEDKAETHRKLPCKYCTFTTQYVFLLMSHMRKIHFSKLSVAAVLRLCFRKGALESGYHCEWCVFSHKKAEVVHKHYQDRHPGCKQMSLGTVKARLFVGIKELHSKGQTSQSSQKDQDRLYHCTLCTFKSNAQRYLTRHCNKFHPSLVKDSPSDKGKREKSELDDLSKMPGLFESFQVPLEDTDEETSSADVIKCPSCPATFHNRHGLSVHTGIKHLNGRNVKKQPEQIEGHVHVYKCPYCNYFNTSHQGVLTHCQMRHPTSTSRADGLYLDTARLSDCDDFTKGNSFDEVSKFSGYMCKTCPQICETLDKLKRHREKDHNETTSGVTKPASSTPKLSLKINLAKPNRTLKSVSKASLLTKKVYIKIKCPQCPYVCSTHIGLNSHMLKQHNNAAPEDGIHKCMLCSQTYPFKRRLAKHYARTHGKGAFQKYFIPLYKPFQKKKELSSQQQQSNSEKRLVYKCPTCPYVNTSYHGTLTHCQMKHPSFTVRADELETGKGSYKTEKQDNKDEAEEKSAQLQREDGKAAPLKIVLKKFSSYKCEKCPNSMFDSSQLLIEHYNNFHHLSNKSDFTVVSFGVRKKSTGLYKCNFCRKNLHGIRYLTRHLDRHRDQMKMEASSFASGRADPPSPKVSYSSPRCKNTKSYQFPVKSLKRLPKKQFLPKGCCSTTRSKPIYNFKSTKIFAVETSPKILFCFCSAFHLLPYLPAAVVSQQKDQLPTFETIAELSHWTGAPVEVVTLPSSPPSSSSQVPDVDPEAEAPEAGHTCKRCQRTFMSLKGLRSHERSHAALGAIKKLDNLVNTEFKNNIKKYLLHKPETLKPYRCGCCAYRTNFMALWQSHFLKNHQEFTESYSEPPNVQRQLTHYSLMARNVDKTNMNLHELSLSDGNLQCEMCNFNTEHLSSIRRHYANRHGKKILRCKDCEFYTGLRKNMEMHIETGHSTCQSKPTHLKDLRCPFCLYQTKNKNNMIDHIVLHREERVMPIEVRRPKLSRYLQGIVFRCHKCTFSSGSAENLRLHMMRHDDVKPYKCRLCYFDCTRLTDLEAHLSDKHQVLRNHELVGQVSLDQLEDASEPNREKAVLEECVKEEPPHLEQYAFAPMDGAAELPHDEKLFTCELCGRNLVNISELNRHILRHGV
uniref:C2H2-type domain-containing protein n=1 Tax=Poecilia formosa TaxID=48698 RepID=A0A087XQ85_POEFO